ncbi:hypothetical protein [Hydrogenimonas sp.]
MKKRWKSAFRKIVQEQRCRREKTALYRLRNSPEFDYLVQQ